MTQLISVLTEWKAIATGILFFLSFLCLVDIRFAMIVTIVILVHESGHILFIKNKLAPKLFFIPFLGGVVVPSDFKIKPIQFFWYIFGGPFIGTLFALFCGIIYLFTETIFFLHMTAVGVFINLLNMIPLFPFDGGKMVEFIDKRLWWFGMLLSFFIFYYAPVIAVIGVVFTSIELYSFYKNPKVTVCLNCNTKNNVADHDNKKYMPICKKCQLELSIPYGNKFKISSAYFSLLAIQFSLLYICLYK